MCVDTNEFLSQVNYKAIYALPLCQPSKIKWEQLFIFRWQWNEKRYKKDQLEG